MDGESELPSPLLVGPILHLIYGSGSIKLSSYGGVYRDLRSRLSRQLYIVLICSTVFTGATFVAVILSNLLYCRPISSLW